ncbi:D-amino acid dehydrogenase small subunit [compost metagenome]
MKPLVGPAYRHKGLWFHFGHGHQGLTLGPASARLLAEQFCGEPTLVPAQPFLPSRFARQGNPGPSTARIE